MFMRVDKLLIELPMPKKQDPNAGAALQELLGGKYGESLASSSGPDAANARSTAHSSSGKTSNEQRADRRR